MSQLTSNELGSDLSFDKLAQYRLIIMKGFQNKRSDLSSYIDSVHYTVRCIRKYEKENTS
jgi:hypothetical protein